MKERVTGMVLSAAAIGEYDKRIVLLTRERGRISAFAKGARRPRSSLSAPTEPFTFGIFYLFCGRNSYTVEQVEVKKFFPELRNELEAMYLAFYFCEVADYFTREEVEATEELNLLYMSFRALTAASIPQLLVRYIYEFRMLCIEGEAPRIFECIRCGDKESLHHFSARDSGIVCDKCYGSLPSVDRDCLISISETTIYTLQRIASAPLEKLYTFTVGENILAELRRVVERYFKARTDRNFRSESFLESL